MKRIFVVVCLMGFCVAPIFGDSPQTQPAYASAACQFVTAENMANAYKAIYGKSLKLQISVSAESVASAVPPKAQPDCDLMLPPVYDYLDHLGKFVIADCHLPKAVYETAIKLPVVQAEFHVKKEVLTMIEALNLKVPEEFRIELKSVLVFYGAGIPLGQCEISTAKHLKEDEDMRRFLYREFGYNGSWYDKIDMVVRFRVGSMFYKFTMVQIMEDGRDRMKLKINPAAFWNMVRQETDAKKQEDYRTIFYLLMTGVETTTAHVGDTVYMMGYHGLSVTEEKTIPLAPFIFSGMVTVDLGGQLLVKQGVEPGYSGGAAITADGKACGMLLVITPGRQFTGGIEIHDILPKK